jgi:mannose-6-phosphate isomerase-like protein (cupin superfamily)/HAMP domain-containing protein
MRTVIIMAFAALVLSATAWAQSPLKPLAADRTYVSSADITAIMNKIAAEGTGQKSESGARLLQSGSFKSNMEYRTAVSTSGLHETEDEFFFVVDGSGTLVTGGKLINPKRQDAKNILGTGLEGGTAQKIGKGDAVVVPRNTPHWFSAINGRLVLISMRLPEAASAPRP